jgi:ABC-type phosphate transport system permease subunit
MSRLHITVQNITNLAYKQKNRLDKNKQTDQYPLQEIVFWKCIVFHHIMLCISLRYWFLYSLQIIFAFKPLSFLMQHTWQNNTDYNLYYYKLHEKEGNEIQQE